VSVGGEGAACFHLALRRGAADCEPRGGLCQERRQSGGFIDVPSPPIAAGIKQHRIKGEQAVWRVSKDRKLGWWKPLCSSKESWVGGSRCAAAFEDVGAEPGRARAQPKVSKGSRNDAVARPRVAQRAGPAQSAMHAAGVHPGHPEPNPPGPQRCSRASRCGISLLDACRASRSCGEESKSWTQYNPTAGAHYNSSRQEARSI